MARSRSTEAGFEAIRIEGGILPSEFLNDVRAQKLPGQQESDYQIPKGLKLRDEIGRYWRIAQSIWEGFSENRERTDLDQRKISVDQCILPLLRDVFGFKDLIFLDDSFIIGNRQFPITHQAFSGAVPFVLTAPEYLLDKAYPEFGDDGRKRSPAGLVQEYLNAEDKSLWAIVCNADYLRIYRDNPSITRPAYIEIDFSRLFNEELYYDFATVWLILHGSRYQPQKDKISLCFLEQWREEAIEVGERQKELRVNVEFALRTLGSGFISHSKNQHLRELISNGEITADQYFQQLLRLIYRLLFLLTTEDREILFDPKATNDAKSLYIKGYSLNSLRERAQRKRHYDQYTDSWDQLIIVFRSLNKGEANLGLPPLGGLFENDQCNLLENGKIENEYLLAAIRSLTIFQKSNITSRINYRDMDTEELGSVYESLLELVPQIHVGTSPWTFGFVGDNVDAGSRGHSRKLTGSYYTPDSLVQELIKSTLVPVIERTLRENPKNPKESLLKLKIVDPAAGSGHFLLAAARRMAGELARVEAGSNQATDLNYRHALREIVSHCIYGVDMNPLAVELCKTALWLETVEPGKPLGFLDSHIRCGNSLIGVIDPVIMKDGIPDSAFKEITGDDNKVRAQLKKRNQYGTVGVQAELFEGVSIEKPELCATNLDEMPEETPEQITAKKLEWERVQSSALCRNQKITADYFTAAFFAHKTLDNINAVPTNEDLWRHREGLEVRAEVVQLTRKLANSKQFFHWYIEFVDIFDHGGFDVVLGNPPWDKIQVEEQAFFESKDSEIEKATGHKRKNLIKSLEKRNPELYLEFMSYRRKIACLDSFIKKSENYPLTGVGKVNTYAIFSELSSRVISKSGRCGMVVPLGIATDDYTKAFFSNLVKKNRLVSLYGFENEEFIFKSVHHATKFVLLTLAGEGESLNEAEYAYFCRNTSQLQNKERKFRLSFENINKINPNTQTSPTFRTSYDAGLNKYIYSNFPVIKNEKENINPWGCAIHRMFNPTDDSELFVTLDTESEELVSNEGESDVEYCPLYEGKMIHQYDHRFGTYLGQTDAQARQGKLPELSDDEHADPYTQAIPRYWLPKKLAEEAISRHTARKWLIAYRDVTSSVVLRTVIACIIPRYPAVDPCRLIYMPDNLSADKICCFLACLNSLVFDYCARQKVSGNHLAIFVFKQLPIIPPEKFGKIDVDFIVPRVLQLSYTSHDLKPFAKELKFNKDPFEFNSNERHVIKSELDAYIAMLYGMSREELGYILDPKKNKGPDCPSETFRVLKNKEMQEFGEYRTERLVLEAFDKLEAGELH